MENLFLLHLAKLHVYRYLIPKTYLEPHVGNGLKRAMIISETLRRATLWTFIFAVRLSVPFLMALLNTDSTPHYYSNTNKPAKFKIWNLKYDI